MRSNSPYDEGGAYPCTPDTYRHVAEIVPVRVTSLDEFLNAADDLPPLSDECASEHHPNCLTAECHCMCHWEDGEIPYEDIAAHDARMDKLVDADIEYVRAMGQRGGLVWSDD